MLQALRCRRGYKLDSKKFKALDSNKKIYKSMLKHSSLLKKNYPKVWKTRASGSDTTLLKKIDNINADLKKKMSY